MMRTARLGVKFRQIIKPTADPLLYWTLNRRRFHKRNMSLQNRSHLIRPNLTKFINGHITRGTTTKSDTALIFCPNPWFLKDVKRSPTLNIPFFNSFLYIFPAAYLIWFWLLRMASLWWCCLAVNTRCCCMTSKGYHGWRSRWCRRRRIDLRWRPQQPRPPLPQRWRW